MAQVIVRWITRDNEAIRLIREKFEMPTYTTVNGLSPADIKEEDMPLFEETSRRGFFDFWYQKWCINGGVLVFKSRQ